MKDLGAPVSDEWKPPAGGNEKMMVLLQKMKATAKK
jgi:hypothetical protein